MKQALFTVSFLLISVTIFCQSAGDLKLALQTTGKAVQAVHHYPADTKKCPCHFVPVTSININENNITIVETWTNWKGTSATTTLTGVLQNNIAKGTWKSTYSGGNWMYNFSTQTGEWNKTKTIMLIFGKFNKYEKLEFKVINQNQLRDSCYSCK